MGINPKDVYVCVVFHSSELRPRGLEIANQFIDSWIASDLGYNLIVLDNQSTDKFDRLQEIPHTFVRVEDQNKNGGITGAWNDIIKLAINKGGKVITGFADDVKINTSLKALVEATVDDDTVYVPLTDGMLDIWPHQKSNQIKPNYTKQVKTINGFWMSFTEEFYRKRQVEGKLFDFSRKEIGKWDKQENALNLWNESHKTFAVVVGDCWLHHTKLRSWREARDRFNN